MTFIVGEIGSNFSSLEDIFASIASLKECGADAAKLQYFTPHDLYFNGDLNPKLNPDWFTAIKKCADSNNIELMITAFSPYGVHLVDPYVLRHKIASAELAYTQLLEAIRECGKPVIASTGGQEIEEIRYALKVLQGSPVALMHCVSDYPARSCMLPRILELESVFDLHTIGYSCHSPYWETPVEAVVKYGAAIIEKHFKLYDMNTPDNPHAILPQDFKKMVEHIRVHEMPDREVDFKAIHKRRLIALTNISKGETLEYSKNYGCYRGTKSDIPARLLSPFSWETIEGKSAAYDIKAFDALKVGCFD